MHHMAPSPAAFKCAGPLSGRVRVPGDKSISHRSLMLSALAVGESTVEGLLEGEDVLATAAAMRAMGADIVRDQNGRWTIHGVGVGGLLQPAQALDMGNSGTSTRLLMGLIASHPITATFIGDASLSKRPMNRVIEPLSQMGADFSASPGGRLPLMLRGLSPAVPIEYRLPVASAQVKSAILLAGLNTPGITRVIEPVPWDLAQLPFADDSTAFGATLVRVFKEKNVPLFVKPAVRAPMRVLMGANMPAVLIELAFMSNGADEALLGNADWQAGIVDGVLAALTELRRGGPGGVPQP